MFANASIHPVTSVLQRRAVWEERNGYLVFLPAYLPHLNIAETIWRHIRGGWLWPQGYAQPDELAYATGRALANFGKRIRIQFSPFSET